MVRRQLAVELDGVQTLVGAAVAVDGTTAYALCPTDAHQRVGSLLAWTRRHDAERLVVFTDDSPDVGVAARRAALFSTPIEVRSVSGDTAALVESSAPWEVSTAPAGLEPFIEVLVAAGAEPVLEHGVLRGEVLGLEVARVERDGDRWRMAVGVGRHDREAFALLHGDLPTTEALSRVIDAVGAQRHPSGEHHPLGRLAPERWLRHVVVRRPELIDATRLEPVEAVDPRSGVGGGSIAATVGADGRGPLVAACVVGVDLDAIAAAADARLTHAPDARLVVVLPERDAHPAVARLAGALCAPAELRTVPAGWRGLA